MQGCLIFLKWQFCTRFDNPKQQYMEINNSCASTSCNRCIFRKACCKECKLLSSYILQSMRLSKYCRRQCKFICKHKRNQRIWRKTTLYVNIRDSGSFGLFWLFFNFVVVLFTEILAHLQPTHCFQQCPAKNYKYIFDLLFILIRFTS